MTRTSDPYEALASLFLTDAREPGEGEVESSERNGGRLATLPAAGTRSHVEIALVGHLPVMGGLWLTQYADQVARTDGPTALIRLERGQATVELLRAPGQRAGLEGIETLDEAIHLLAERAHRWIVCPHGESALEGPLPADSLTLLSGSDDAATVAAYRMVKSLAERWHASAWPIPPIGLVVLGAPRDRVSEVAEKLDRTTKAFLDVDLTVVGQFQRMDAIESAGRRTFPGVEPTLLDVTRRIDAAIDRARRIDERRVAARPAPRAMPYPRVAQTNAPPASHFVDRSLGELDATAEPRNESNPRDRVGRDPEFRAQAVSTERITHAIDSPDGLAAQRIEVDRGNRSWFSSGANAGTNAQLDAAFDVLLGQAETLPFREGLSATNDPSGESIAVVASNSVDQSQESLPSWESIPSMATLLPGLDPLPARCPGHRAIELAVDASGSLHLVAASDHVAAIRPVEVWVRAHWNLLRLACPRLAGECPEPITVHVATTHAPAVVALYGTDLVLHLFVAAPSGWIHAPLS